MRILLVEDEKKIASFIERGLKEQRYAVDVASDGQKGSFLADVNDYDLIILDIMLPGKDGISISKELRKKQVNPPILMLTARNSVKDKVLGLDAGVAEQDIFLKSRTSPKIVTPECFCRGSSHSLVWIPD